MGQGSSCFTNQHVIITGGSQGLGLHLAAEFAKDGARVTIISRNPDHLADAKAFIETTSKSYVQSFQADVKEGKQLRAAIRDAVAKFGPVDVLVACAGFAPTGYFMEMEYTQFQDAMNLNYYGTLNAVRAVVPAMKTRQRGRIVLVSSGLALTGFIGYSAYCPSKWAVRGLGEALRNELLPYNITVQQVFPPGMDTPGFEVENRTKPAETKAIEAGEKTHKPEDCARAAFKEIARNQYHCTCGDFNLGMLARGAAGMSPRTSYLFDFFFLPIMVVVGKFVQFSWDREVCSSKWKRIE